MSEKATGMKPVVLTEQMLPESLIPKFREAEKAQREAKATFAAFATEVVALAKKAKAIPEGKEMVVYFKYNQSYFFFAEPKAKKAEASGFTLKSK